MCSPALVANQVVNPSKPPKPPINNCPLNMWSGEERASSIEYILKTVCSELGFNVGQFFTHDNSLKSVLQGCGRWRSDKLDAGVAGDIDEFTSVSASLSFTIGEDVPGKSWQSGHPEWIDLSSIDPSLAQDPYISGARKLFRFCASIPVFSPSSGSNARSEHSREHLIGVFVFCRSELMNTGETNGNQAQELQAMGAFCGATVANAIQFAEARNLLSAHSPYDDDDECVQPDQQAIFNKIQADIPEMVVVESEATAPQPPDSHLDMTLVDQSRTTGKISIFLRQYIGKMKGSGAAHPPRASFTSALWTWLGAFVALAVLARSAEVIEKRYEDLVIVFGSWGALATLLFSVQASPLAQPRIVIVAHVLCSVVAITTWYLMSDDYADILPTWFGYAFATSTSIALMAYLGITHPPAGAVSLIFVSGSKKVTDLMWLYLVPVVGGCCVMIAIAVVVNNLSSKRRYPMVW